MDETLLRLGTIASARSGDKGTHANVAVIARCDLSYRYLEEVLTTERVADFFGALKSSNVERFLLPKLGSLNFLLRDALAGGASRSLRIDTQGKLLGTAILELQLPLPVNIEKMRTYEF